MPECSSDNYSRYWTSSSSPPISRSNSVSPPLASTLSAASPQQVSPVSTLKRSTSNVSTYSNTSSNLSHVSSHRTNAPTVIYSPRRLQKYLQHHLQETQDQQNHQQQNQRQQLQQEARTDNLFFPSRLLIWYINLLKKILFHVYTLVSYVFWAPALWTSTWICLFWVILQLPLTLLKWFLTILHTPASERARNKRCVLISGGSTVQTVHLARNFYKAGARVVVCDLEGMFGLARFSTACSKYYTVPKPGPGTAAEYIKALKDIVLKERAMYYIPVCATNTAYYDALAKPHLEMMGCECFVPSAAEVTALDDPLELLRRCRTIGLPTSAHFILRSIDDVSQLYEAGTLSAGRHVMMPAGPAGMRDRTKIILPRTLREFRNQRHDINEKRPWVVVRDPGGEYFITCTTVKESRLVANVTCRVDEEKRLIPEEHPDVNLWLQRFFSNRMFGNRINGHLSFRLAKSTETGDLLSLGCRVGVSLPYICHTGIHPRLVWRPCRHFSRQNSVVLLERQDPHATSAGFKRVSDETNYRLLGTVLDKREALFVYWDPLPYCAYFHIQLPFRRVTGAIRAQPAQHNPPLAVVQ